MHGVPCPTLEVSIQRPIKPIQICPRLSQAIQASKFLFFADGDWPQSRRGHRGVFFSPASMAKKRFAACFMQTAARHCKATQAYSRPPPPQGVFRTQIKKEKPDGALGERRPTFRIMAVCMDPPSPPTFAEAMVGKKATEGRAAALRYFTGGRAFVGDRTSCRTALHQRLPLSRR